MSVREKIEITNLPLAVYRELTAHLRQVEGVEVSLIPQSDSHFDYSQSQISGVWIEYTLDFQESNRLIVKQILDFYRNRYQ
ncbi:MAG: hypothetical protein AAF378_13265 [Cyanobacteria bacterium P01_A01_bin.84]